MAVDDELDTSGAIVDWLSSVRGAPDRQFHGSEPPKISRASKRKVDMEVDADSTPVSTKRVRTGQPLLPSPTTNPRQFHGSAISIDQRSSLYSSTTRSRSNSPIKRKRDLEFVKPRIMFKTLKDLQERRSYLEERIPLLRSLLTAVEEAQTNLPTALEVFIRAVTSSLSGEVPGPFSSTSALQPFSSLEPSLIEILQATEFCKEREATEEEWSDKVVYPTLVQAARRVQGQAKVDIITAKAIDISPRDLLPAALLGGRTQKKRVDYALGLDLPNLDIVCSIVGNVEGRSLNQSDHTRLCYEALFSHLEIKRNGNRDGEIQLGVWCAAGFKRTEELGIMRHGNEEASPLAVIPLWLWEEDSLGLLVAIYESSEEIAIYHISKWSSGREQQLLRAIITLTRVMEWGAREYLPWFKKHIGYNDT